VTVPYPASASERTHWILARRGSRNAVSAVRPHAFFSERERTKLGIEDVSTVFLTNRECPWKCVMCDLWRNTTEYSLKADDIVEQIRFATEGLPHAPVLKLYNSGSFFDPAAIPRAAWKQIAELCQWRRHVVLECHPRLVGPQVLDFASLLPGTLEIALGLETAHPEALKALNKRITVADYQRAAEFLKTNGIGLRTFLLVHPPFIPAEECSSWLRRSIELAFDSGSDVASLIPLRSGNGAVADLVAAGSARLPSLADLEDAQEHGLQMRRGLCLADTWDLQLFSKCPACLENRSARIERMNLTQEIEDRFQCDLCDG